MLRQGVLRKPGWRRALAALTLGQLCAVTLFGCGFSGDMPSAPESGTPEGDWVQSSRVAGVKDLREASLGAVRPNRLPETVISFFSWGGPPGDYRVRVHWFGWDWDGEIERFELRIADDGVLSDWISTVRIDTVILVNPDVVTAWQVAVRSVDDDGEADPSPAKETYLIGEGRILVGERATGSVGARPN